MSTVEKLPENGPETGQNSAVSSQQRVCLNYNVFFSPADLESHKLSYSLMFGVECPTSIELYCPTCVEVLSQAIAESSQPWDYPTDEELEQAFLLSDVRDDF